MAQRGTQEFQPSSNPFFQTTYQTIGKDPFEKDKWERDRLKKQASEDSKAFSFLYSRESDRIGSRPDLINNDLPSQDEMAVIPLSRIVQQQQQREDKANKIPSDQFLQSYVHVPKAEHPRYQTAGNDYGRKLPSEATLVTERYSKQQDFSRSFANIKPRSSTMNTAITRSTIHKSLDPQFL